MNFGIILEDSWIIFSRMVIPCGGDDIDRALALDRTEHSFSRTAVRGYSDSHGAAQFLYYFSNSLWKLSENRLIGDRTSIGVDALVYDQAIPPDKVVERAPNGEIVVRDRRSEHCMAQQYFNVEIT